MGIRSYIQQALQSTVYYGSNVNRSITSPIVTRGDEFFNYTSLLLDGDGTNGTQNNTFLDSSSNNFTITRNGNTTQGTLSPFGDNWSNYFDGSGDYLGNTSSALIGPSINTFTVESWIYMTANPTFNTIEISGLIGLDAQPANTTNYLSFGPISSRQLRLYWYDGAQKTATGSTALNLNQWYHVACVINSNTIKFYVNGVEETLSGTTTLTNRSGTISNFSVGSNYYGAFSGYISNLRVTTAAVYSSAFTPPTEPLTAVTNTVLLTCQSNRFRDNSTNNFTITPSGDVRVEKFNPFGRSTAYDSDTDGGSGYFDGSGDRLSIPGNSAFDVSSGNFTAEVWIYPTSNTLQVLFQLFTATNNNYAGLTFGITRTTSSTITVEGASPSVGGGAPAFSITSSNIAPINSWSHIAITRNSNTFTLWINGVSSGTSTFSGTLYWSPPNLYVGNANDSSSYPFSGHISNLRLLKGTALYTTNFTPPTAPLTAVTNTSLLLNFTNAAIKDSTGLNNLETVGNAQISTTQSKFGGSSLYFDGTGDQLLGTTSPNLIFGTGDFTIEAWVYQTQRNSLSDIVSCHNYGVDANWLWSINSSGNLYLDSCSSK
jgi:hypothetical protein